MLYEGVNKGEKDFSSIVSKIKWSDADYLMYGGLHTEGGLIIRQMRDQGVKAVMRGGDGMHPTTNSPPIAGPGVEGTLMLFFSGSICAKIRLQRTSWPRSKPKASIRRDIRSTPTPQSEILKQAAEKAKSLDPKKVAEVMHSGMAFNTVIGPIAYDKKGDRISADYDWYVWEKSDDGKITYKQLGGQSGGPPAGLTLWKRLGFE